MSQHDKVSPEFPARFSQVWSDHDLDTLTDHTADERTFMASAAGAIEGTKWVGRENIREGFAGVWDGYPDVHFAPIGKDFIVDDRGCPEWIFTGTRAANGKIALKNSNAQTPRLIASFDRRCLRRT